MWGGAKLEKEWYLMAWEKLYRPKLRGGFRLRDPSTLPIVLGAKIWWRWI